MSCTVMNLTTQEKFTYTCTPRDAVIACYAQSLGDFNTWDYTKKYGRIVESGHDVFLCGDFSAFQDGRQF